MKWALVRTARVVLILAMGLSAGAAAGYWYARAPSAVTGEPAAAAAEAAGERKIFYYRDPSGAPYWSATPRKDDRGRDYLPVYEDEEFPEKAAKPKTAAPAAARKILYYRNPMGLPDTSPVPKKDWMGMDYIPVYEGEEQDDGKTVRVSLDKVQRSGVRTEKAAMREVVREVRAAGTVARDETRLTSVTMRSEGFVEDLFVSRTGQHVEKGEKLFRVYSPDIQRAQIDLLSAMRGPRGTDGERMLDGAMQRLRNLGVPEERIREVREKGANPRTLDWPSPTSGDVIVKNIVKGQRVAAGDELYRIADHSTVWVIADVAEADLPMIAVGTQATVTLRAYSAVPVTGRVRLIYPELRPETRTARVRIELTNREGLLKIDMYADVAFATGGETKVIAVPDSAVIDSGLRQAVLVAKGEGRFEPRQVKLGRRGGGYTEIREGIAEGEEIVTSATFLIDAESNLKAALQSFAREEAPQ